MGQLGNESMAITDFARDWCIARLATCHTVADLQRTWNDMGETYQTDRRIMGYYLLRLKQLGGSR